MSEVQDKVVEIVCNQLEISKEAVSYTHPSPRDRLLSRMPSSA